MKNFILLLLSSFTIISANGNPLPAPEIVISELYFDDSGEWTLEFKSDVSDGTITISSMTDTATITLHFIDLYGARTTITEDSLSQAFHINPLGDVLTLTALGNISTLAFGDFENADIKTLSKGQSISLHKNTFCKCNKPTLGYPNEEGSYGYETILAGTVYDINNAPLKNTSFELYNKITNGSTFTTDENGTYTCKVLARNWEFDKVNYLHNDETARLQIETISIDEPEPDSVIELGIYLKEETPLKIKETGKDLPIEIFPNLVRTENTVSYKIGFPVKTAAIYLEVIDIDGKLLSSQKITENSGKLAFGFENGVYYVRSRMDEKLLAVKKIIVNHE